MVYDDGSEFHSFGNLTKEVPVIALGSISKIYCLPGWRLGWSIVYNHNGYFDNVLEHLSKHSMIQLHPCSLVQFALPKILKDVPEQHFIDFKAKIKETSEFAFKRL